MIQNILLGVCLAGVGAFLPLSVVLWLHEHDVRPVDEVIGRFRRLPKLVQIGALVIVANLIAYGGSKTNRVDGTSSPTNSPTSGGGSVVDGGDDGDGFGGGSVTNDPWTGDGPSTNTPPLLGLMRPPSGIAAAGAPEESEPEVVGFTDEEVSQGYATWRVGTNETWSFAPPPGAEFVEKWLLRGAAEDWADLACVSSFTGSATMDTFGRVCWSNRVYSVLERPMSIVPRTNWGLLGSNVASRAWCAVTPWGSTIFTWENALLDRDTNTPVSVQAEFTAEGHWIYRYDLSRAGTNLTSVLHYGIRPEDLVCDDRDGDGIPTWQEVKGYHSDPGLVDSDGDGIPDWDEVCNGTDPAVRSVPNSEIVARVTGSPTNDTYRYCSVITNGTLVSMKLWDGFAADWDSDSDIVFERTLDLGSQSGWQHYFLSSKEDGAGDWDLRGMVLEWDDWCGSTGRVNASPRGDSFYLPLTNCSSSVTIRLRAIGPKVRSPKPMWLLGYSPVVNYGNGQLVVSEDETQAALVVNAQDGMTVNLSFDRTWRPCNAPLYPAEELLPGIEDAETESGGMMSYSGDGNSGTLTIMRPGEYQFPSIAVEEVTNPSWMFANGWGGGFWIVIIDPSISWGGCHRYSTVGCYYDWWNDEYSVTFNYPLNSRCLWNAWQENYDGGHDDCDCEPDVKSGAEGSGAWLVSTDYSIDWGSMVATGYVKIFDKTVWSDTCEHTYGDTIDEWYGGGTHSGCTLLTELEECEECEDSCTGGKCNYGEESTLNSVKFRLPLGTPRTGQSSGWIYFESDNPVTITPSIFQWMKRDDANVTHTQSGSTRTWRCSDNRGRDVVLTAIQNGVRLTVSDHVTTQLDHTWEITNVNGSRNQIRLLRRNKRNLRMVDETFVYASGDWSKTDNVSGLREVLHRVNDINGSGQITETRTKYDADNNQLDQTVSVSTRIGRYDNAVIRETYFEQDTGYNTKWRRATYWDDPSHAGRHGQLKLLTGNSTAWEYHDWDQNGLETLRVEQRNGSDVPSSFPALSWSGLTGLEGLADATVTVFGYTPVGNDDCLAEDSGRVRSETKYVVRNGQATCIAKTWTVFSHQWVNWYPALKVETYRAANPYNSWNDADNAHSYVITFDSSADGVPIVMRGMTAEELDENGVCTYHDVWDGWDCVYDEEWTEFGGHVSPTIKITTRDSSYGNVLSVETYTRDNWEMIDSEYSSYDDQNRLLGTWYHDGTYLENQYSCCRLLQSRDREGRLTVRSAVTGEDKVYYAEESVYMNEVQTNGFGVTQHFMDALGRETRTVTYLGRAQGEAADWTVSQGRELTESTTSYPYGGDDYSVAVDERGKKTVTGVREYADRTETEESVCPSVNGTVDHRTVTTEYRNGDFVTATYWGNKWKREYTVSDYDANGCRVDTSVTESSDYGAVTNRIVRHDFLGRAVETVGADGTTSTTYFGTSSHPSESVKVSGGIVRTCAPVYNDLGEEVGANENGVTTRSDVTYEYDDCSALWKVTRSTRAAEGCETDCVREIRERMTGFGEGVRSERIDIDANGVASTNTVYFDSANGTCTTVFSTPLASPSVQVAKYGLVLSEQTGDGTTTAAYDPFGRCVRRDRDGRIPEALVYNALGDVVERQSYTNAAGYVTETFGYDTYGRQVSVVDALGNEVVTEYDANGLVTAQSGATYPVRFGYDALGNRISLQTTKNGSSWQTTSWIVDPLTSKVTAKTYPGGGCVAYTFTPDGLEQRETQASGAWCEFAYDSRRQRTATIYRDPTLNAASVYDVFGQLVAETNAVSGIAYDRAKDGAATNETWCVGAHEMVLERQRDAFGRIVGRGLTNGVWQSVSYSEENRIEVVAADEATANYAYAEDGAELGYALTMAGGTTIRRQVIRDAYRPELVVAVSNFVGGVSVNATELGYDALSRVSSRNSSNVTYNARSELTGDLGAVYAYDQIGNFAGQTIAYNCDGQVEGEDGLGFTYDDAGHLRSVTSNGVTLATYAYDPQERRVRKVTPTATHTYFYDGWALIREVIDREGGDSETIDYCWGRDLSGSLDGAGGVGGLLFVKMGGEIYAPLYDHNGNVTAYVNRNGEVVARYAYDAFGAILSATGPMAEAFRFRFSTKYTDPESGLSYYGYRYYSPKSRIWLTRDPLGENAGLNLHSFCGNDPMNKIDAYGLAQQQLTEEDIRQILNAVPEFFKQNNWPLAAEMFNYAYHLTWQPPTDRTIPLMERKHYKKFSEGAAMTSAIKSSRGYAAAMKSFYGTKGKWTSDEWKKITSVSFNYGVDNDLFFAVHAADVYAKGEVCRSKTKVKIKSLEIVVEDEYDFHELEINPQKQGYKRALINAANNFVYAAQQAGFLKKYLWYSKFKETRTSFK